ncbi:GLN4 [Candida oxycetoniae]|uniref:glutamine--tRNA ligase n=1 Tax=Candida oxycetoniae TaxID=497107 RepID=A0AAI9WYL0_9ASCO|nr:GLN4 [Candida oxycetoniae]KAI3405150.2 GLN4 [Candida oxycetoniae]
MSLASDEELVSLFNKVGFEDKKSKEIAKNSKVANLLKSILLKACGDENECRCDEKRLALLHQLAVLENKQGQEVPNVEYLIRGIENGTIKTNLQLSEGMKYLTSTKEPKQIDFDEATGVNVEISEKDLKMEISKYLDTIEKQLLAERYSLLPKVLSNVKSQPRLKWASPNLFKPVLDELFLAKLGPKDERDTKKKEKKPKTSEFSNKDNKKTTTAAAAATASTEPEKERSMFSEGFLGDLHKPGEEPQKYPELLKAHNEFIKGKVYTRFPPEPNGFLHIGHSKAIMVNFGYAQFHKGQCYLRFDDTNPEAEEEIYFESIKEMVSWLGYKPWKVTYSSDYFDELYELAVKLIKADKAYICHCTAEEVKLSRGQREDGSMGGERFACKHRTQSIEHNLAEFENMKLGKYAIGEATLRMKQDLTSPSPQMWDLVAYRVLNKPHHRTGSKWKIYPTYDFTHCLVDSLENITHSLCTTEFILSRESYEWLCDALHVYRPAQREYGRLNLTGTIMSKRKIAKLVNEGYVRGWDDPRLYTLEGIKRRGVPPGAILSFINTLGVTTSTTNIQTSRFESSVRSYLDHTTPRLFLILNPIEVHIDNLDDSFSLDIEIPYKPGTDVNHLGNRKLTFKNKIYIDRNDVRDVAADKQFFRLAPGQPVGLMKVPFNISFKSIETGDDGKTIVHVNYDDSEAKPKKPKTYIQWVPVEDSIRVKEVRIYNQLFKSENPAAHPDGFLKDINESSESVLYSAVIECNFNEIRQKSPMNLEISGSQFNIKEEKGNNTIRFQALREGYFCVDKDDKDNGELILNRIVTLKEDANK